MNSKRIFLSLPYMKVVNWELLFERSYLATTVAFCSLSIVSVYLLDMIKAGLIESIDNMLLTYIFIILIDNSMLTICVIIIK